MGALHDELVSLDGEFAPAGQHIFGRNLSEEDRLDTFHACLEFADVDVHRLVGNCYGLDYDTLSRAPDARSESGVFNHEVLEDIRDASRTLIESEVLRGGDAGRNAVLGILRARKISGRSLGNNPYELQELREFLLRADELWKQLGRVGDAEREGLLTVLDGIYLEPSMGGEIVGDWNVLPTGRNMASTDVRMLPREAARRKGKKTVEQILKTACEKRGSYPGYGRRRSLG